VQDLADSLGFIGITALFPDISSQRIGTSIAPMCIRPESPRNELNFADEVAEPSVGAVAHVSNEF
jgi:hypothetical protein